MKTAWKIFWGIGFVLLAVGLILGALGVFESITGPFGEVSPFALIVSFFLLSYVISRIIKLRIEDIFVPLSLVFMLLERNIAHLCGLKNPDIINNWLLFGCAVLTWIGFSILLSGTKRKRRFKIVHNDGDSDSNDDDDEDGVHFSSSHIGHSVKYIDCERFKYEQIENNLGSFVIFFENVDKYEGGGVLEIENNIGSVTINAPSSWHVKMDIDTSLGATSIPSEIHDGPVLTVKGENNLGKISVKYV